MEPGLYPLVGTETEYGFSVKPGITDSYETICKKLIGAAKKITDKLGIQHVPTKSSQTEHDIMLSNGARMYIDLEHPEYSTPITKTADELILAEYTGDRILELCLAKAQESDDALSGVKLYRDSHDQYGHSYACHENYLVPPGLFNTLTAAEPLAIKIWVPFLVTRQLLCGAGHYLPEPQDEGYRFALSSRTLFIRQICSLDTLVERGIINTRDTPYSDRNRFRRLHVIVGEANRSDYSGFLKIGMTQIVLSMLQSEPIDLDLALEDPVQAIKSISLYPREPVPMAGSKHMTAHQIQYEIFEKASAYVTQLNEPYYREVVRIWGETLLDLQDMSDIPRRTRKRLDWIIKKSFIDGAVEQEKWRSSDARIVELDIGYHRLGKSSVFRILQNKDFVEQRPITKAVNEAILLQPRSMTRAKYRADLIRELHLEIASAIWDKISLKSNKIIELPDPTGSNGM